MGIQETQEAVYKLQSRARILMSQLKAIEDRLEKAKERHRGQIARSLLSKDLEEREMARGIAAWWDVPLVPDSPESAA